MPKRPRPTFQKRQKEQARQQKQQAKAARRLEAKQRRANAASAGMAETALELADLRPDAQSLPTPEAPLSQPE